VDTPRFFNPYEEIRFTENLLPHWQQNGATYFVTFRLADSVPAHLRAQWEEERAKWLRFHPEPWAAETELEYHKRFTGAIERWLDAGYDSCVLRQVDCAKIVDERVAPFRSPAPRPHLVSRYAESRSCVVNSECRASIGTFASQLEYVQFTERKSIGRTVWDFMAKKLLRSSCAGRKTFSKLCPLHPA
jgi:hypothetical protein